MLTVKIINLIRQICKEHNIHDINPGNYIKLHNAFIKNIKTDPVIYNLSSQELDTYFLFFISEHRYTTKKYNLTYICNNNNKYDIVCTNGCYTGDNIISIIFYIYNSKIITREEYVNLLDLFILKFSCDINYIDNYKCTGLIHCMRNTYIKSGEEYDPTDERVFILLNYLKYNPDIYIRDNQDKNIIDYAYELDKKYKTDDLYIDIINEYEKLIKNALD